MSTSPHNPLAVLITSNIDIDKEISIQRGEPIPVEVPDSQSIEVNTITPRTIQVNVDGMVKQYSVSSTTTININSTWSQVSSITLENTVKRG